MEIEIMREREGEEETAGSKRKWSLGWGRQRKCKSEIAIQLAWSWEESQQRRWWRGMQRNTYEIGQDKCNYVARPQLVGAASTGAETLTLTSTMTIMMMIWQPSRVASTLANDIGNCLQQARAARGRGKRGGGALATWLTVNRFTFRRNSRYVDLHKHGSQPDRLPWADTVSRLA